MPKNLIEPKITKEQAEETAYNFIRNRIGNIPHIREAVFQDGKWVIPIDVSYPKVFFNKETNIPIKTRFIKIPNVGRIELSAKDGNFIHYPTVWGVESAIGNGLQIIENSVEKALVKVGASNFSQLAYSEYRYSPIVDILATLLTEERFSLSDLAGEEQTMKYSNYIDDLQKIGLVRVSEDLVIPGNLFTILEEKYENAKKDEQLSALLTLFFERGFNYIQSVRAVLGSHLALGGFIYKESWEFQDRLVFNKDDIATILANEYKKIKISRYFLQLEKVGVIEEDISLGETAWKPTANLFDKFKNENDILAPATQMMQANSSVLE